jgi:hypothetical protein
MAITSNATTLTFNNGSTQTVAPVNTNANVNSVSAGTGISVSATTGALTVTNSGVTSVSAGTGISVSASTGGVTISVSGAGTVTSVATGNGLQGGTITSSGTLSITAPSYQSIGSYGTFTNISGLNELTLNTNYSGTRCTPAGQNNDGDPVYGPTAPGTWRMLGRSSATNSYWLGVRVS